MIMINIYFSKFNIFLYILNLFLILLVFNFFYRAVSEPTKNELHAWEVKFGVINDRIMICECLKLCEADHYCY